MRKQLHECKPVGEQSPRHAPTEERVLSFTWDVSPRCLALHACFHHHAHAFPPFPKGGQADPPHYPGHGLCYSAASSSITEVSAILHPSLIALRMASPVAYASAVRPEQQIAHTHREQMLSVGWKDVAVQQSQGTPQPSNLISLAAGQHSDVSCGPRSAENLMAMLERRSDGVYLFFSCLDALPTAAGYHDSVASQLTELCMQLSVRGLCLICRAWF